MSRWVKVGSTNDIAARPLQEIVLDGVRLAISYQHGQFGAVSGVCNHIGGPLGQGHLDGDYIVCPWHYWKFHAVSGLGEPGFEADCVPSHATKVENGELWVDLTPSTTRHKLPHPPHALARKVVREPGPIRVVGVSTTAMTVGQPRFSTSDFLLQNAFEQAGKTLPVETRLIKLNALKFRHCEGFYSKHARACTWPCSITQMDNSDQLDQVYEAIVHWGDVIIVATPIRWGAASSLYYKMVERMNCIQNYITTHNRILIRHKVAAFIITGGQDNVQAVAGQMLGFFSELGFVLPPFPFIGHSLGWSAENMERNVSYVQTHPALCAGAQALVGRAVETATTLLKGEALERLPMGGRKAKDLSTIPSS